MSKHGKISDMVAVIKKETPPRDKDIDDWFNQRFEEMKDTVEPDDATETAVLKDVDDMLVEMMEELK